MNVVQNFAPDTIVRYAVSRHFVAGIEDPTSFIIDRVFWIFKPCIEGFAYCKLILQVEGTFLTDKYTVTLLIASSQDEWSNAELFYCIRHLASNFNKKFRDPDIKDKVIQMGYELLLPRFERILSDLREKNLRAGACVLKGFRALPIIALVQTTYYRLNLWFVDHRDEFFKETGVVEVEAASRSGGRHSKYPIMRRKRTGRPKTTIIHNEMDKVELQVTKKCRWCRTECHNRKKCPYRMSELGQSSTQPNDDE
ncbi:hypothetical protein Lal_00027261 [Lupinus albus]|nr:hypothetical protein Lal_00027261 [Lupinus albus]